MTCHVQSLSGENAFVYLFKKIFLVINQVYLIQYRRQNFRPFLRLWNQPRQPLRKENKFLWKAREIFQRHDGGCDSVTTKSDKNSKDFGELAAQVLSRLLSLAKFHKSSRIDFVVDQYPEHSIKANERSRRAAQGSTLVKIYGKNQPTPAQWKKYLSSGRNNEVLFCSSSMEKVSKAGNLSPPGALSSLIWK